MLDVTSLLEEIKASPFEEQEIVAPHTGVVTFGSLKLGDKVIGPNGTWKERPGTLIATITRERNPKPLNAVQKGEVCAIHSELEGTYVQAGTPLATIRHFLSKDEVLRILLKQALNLFVAPERAKYYFVPQIDTSTRSGGNQRENHQDQGVGLPFRLRLRRHGTLHRFPDEAGNAAVLHRPGRAHLYGVFRAQ